MKKYKEVNSTDPSPSVRIPWPEETPYRGPILTISPFVMGVLRQ